MARLPGFQYDLSGFTQGNNLLLRGAENAAEGDAALGRGIGGGMNLLGQGMARGKERREARADRQEALGYRKERDQRQDFEDDRRFEMNRLAGANKLLDDDLVSAEFDYQMMQANAAGDPMALISPEFRAAESRYQDAVARKQSVRGQYEALATQPQNPMHRHAKT